MTLRELQLIRNLRQSSNRPSRGAAPLTVELLEDRLALSNVSLVPVWDGERPAPYELLNYFGGPPGAPPNLVVEHTTADTHSGAGAYRVTIDQPIAVGGYEYFFLSMVGFHADAPGGLPYLDTRDISNFEQASFWIHNNTGAAFTLSVELKDYRDPDLAPAVWSQVIGSGAAWSNVTVPLDVTAANGWAITGPLDPTRLKLIAFVIKADQSTTVDGALGFDDLIFVERGGALDSQTAPINALTDRILRRQFDALWNMRDRDTGLMPNRSEQVDVMALNTTAGMIKLLPGAVQRGWDVTPTQADEYVEQVVNTLDAVMTNIQATGNGGYLPPRYLDRVTLAPINKKEESSVDAAMLALSLYQYQALPRVSNALRAKINTFLNRLNWNAFTSSNPSGWKMAYQYDIQDFTTNIYDGYSGEPWLISLAAELSQNHHIDIEAYYHTATFREPASIVDPQREFLVHSFPQYREPYLQWLFPLWVDVSQRGIDTYPVRAKATNPLDNAVNYQLEVNAGLQGAGRGLLLQPDVADDGTGTNTYREFNVFEDFGQPTLWMPFASSYVFLSDPTAAAAALRNILDKHLDGPLGLADTVRWTTGAPNPTSITAPVDIWNLTLSTQAFIEYRHHDSSYLTNLPAVQQALDLVFVGAVIEESDGATALAEGGVQDSFTMQMSSAPTADVMVQFAPNSQVTFVPTTLTFTPANWADAQTVQVVATDDAVAEGVHFASIGGTLTSADEAYNVGIRARQIAITDNDPQARDDFYGVTTGKTLTVAAAVGVLGNDHGPATARLVTNTTRGKLTLRPDGSFTYKPRASYRGFDSFTYRTFDVDGAEHGLATVTLVPIVNFQAGVSRASEAVTTVKLTVTLSSPSSRRVTVGYAVTGGSALADVDFRLAAGTLTFKPGQTSKDITLRILNDRLDEPNETIRVTLSNPSGAILGARSTRTHTILDNDPASAGRSGLDIAAADLVFAELARVNHRRDRLRLLLVKEGTSGYSPGQAIPLAEREGYRGDGHVEHFGSWQAAMQRHHAARVVAGRRVSSGWADAGRCVAAAGSGGAA